MNNLSEPLRVTATAIDEFLSRLSDERSFEYISHRILTVVHRDIVIALSLCRDTSTRPTIGLPSW